MKYQFWFTKSDIYSDKVLTDMLNMPLVERGNRKQFTNLLHNLMKDEKYEMNESTDEMTNTCKMIRNLHHYIAQLLKRSIRG